jgi:hypothetical protein
MVYDSHETVDKKERANAPHAGKLQRPEAALRPISADLPIFILVASTFGAVVLGGEVAVWIIASRV